jgi:hypothetical protein
LEEKNVPLPDFDMKTNNVIYEVFVTIYSEIVDILKIIDPNKAFGPDKISHKMIHNIVEIFIIYIVSKRRNTVASLI